MRKCIIDNWSLEHAAVLLDGTEDYFKSSNDSFSRNLAGLSNYINSILLYDESYYPSNGFETDWTKYEWFERNTTCYIKPIQVEQLNIKWTSRQSYSDKGINNYLLTARHFQSDLIISPERSTDILRLGVPGSNQILHDVLNNIDSLINSEAEKIWFEQVKIGVDNNFFLPSLTHYVLSQASSVDDLLRVIMEIKSSDRINKVSDQINDILGETKTANRFQKEIESLIKKSFGETPKQNQTWSIKLPVMFFSVNIPVNLNFFYRKEHLLLLKDIVHCRTEINGLAKDIQRVFKRSC